MSDAKTFRSNNVMSWVVLCILALESVVYFGFIVMMLSVKSNVYGGEDCWQWSWHITRITHAMAWKMEKKEHTVEMRVREWSVKEKKDGGQNMRTWIIRKHLYDFTSIFFLLLFSRIVWRIDNDISWGLCKVLRL